ncbi:hypothetical protein QBK99_16725 [Corticibacterium sp. UT-5YL-CI-8]|nr:hypothetical protein [Tianweitania sp. UT-5YL-CI-8]
MEVDKSSLEYRTLERIGDKACFDIGEFLDRISDGKDWVKLIVAHIYLDHIVTQTLIDHLPNHDVYLKGHRAFYDKLALCQALGYFVDEIAPVLNSINSNRNKFAHQLIFNVSDKQKKEMFRTFTNAQPISNVLKPDGFEGFLVGVVILTEFERVMDRRIQGMAQPISDLLQDLQSILAGQYRWPPHA